METSRKEERTTHTLNGATAQQRYTPADSHQPPTRKRNIYLNMALPQGIGETGARAAKKKYYLGVGGRDCAEGGDFFLCRRSGPLLLSDRMPLHLGMFRYI